MRGARRVLLRFDVSLVRSLIPPALVCTNNLQTLQDRLLASRRTRETRIRRVFISLQMLLAFPPLQLLPFLGKDASLARLFTTGHGRNTLMKYAHH